MTFDLSTVSCDVGDLQEMMLPLTVAFRSPLIKTKRGLDSNFSCVRLSEEFWGCVRGFEV